MKQTTFASLAWAGKKKIDQAAEGRSARTKAKKIYSRRRLFEKIKRATAFNANMKKNPNAVPMQAWKELNKENYPGGVKLTTKDRRDYFATQVSAQVTDPNTVKNLMRHSSLNTTSRYTRTVMEHMKAALQNLGKPVEASLYVKQLNPTSCATADDTGKGVNCKGKKWWR